jgi:hypothetical protein
LSSASAAEVIGLLASFIAPFIETLAGNDAAPFLEVLAELPLAHAIRADVQQRRSGLIGGPQPINPKAREHYVLPCHEGRHELCRRDVGIEFEIEARPAVKPAGDVRPFLDRAETIAHGRKMDNRRGMQPRSAVAFGAHAASARRLRTASDRERWYP